MLQTKSVTGTARRLGMSQPTVSRSLAQLRQLLGDPLLVRTGTGMERTRRAEELVEPVERWLATTTSLLHPPMFEPAALDRQFRVASTDYGVLTVVGPALAAIARAAPGVVIDVVPFSADMMQKLASGELDFVITGLDPDRSLAYDRHLFADSFTCIMRAGHHLAAGAGAIDLEDYLTASHVGLTVSEFDRVAVRLGDRAGERRVTMRLPYFYAAPDLIAGSDAVMTMPTRAATKFAAAYGLVARPAPVEIGGLDYWLQWHERSVRDPAATWLSDMFAEHSASFA